MWSFFTEIDIPEVDFSLYRAIGAPSKVLHSPLSITGSSIASLKAASSNTLDSTLKATVLCTTIAADRVYDFFCAVVPIGALRTSNPRI